MFCRVVQYCLAMKRGVIFVRKNKYNGKPFTLTIDERYLNAIRYKLGDMEKRAPNVLANALNQTLTQLKRYVPKRVSELYTYKRTLQVPKPTRASYQKLRVTLLYSPIPKKELEKISLKSFDFKVGSYGTPRNTPGIKFQAKVDSNGSFEDRDGVFEMRDELLARVEHDRYPLKHAVGPSETTMVKSVWAQRNTQRDVGKELSKRLDLQINNQYLKKWGLK